MVGSFVFLFRKMVSFCVYDNINMGVNNMDITSFVVPINKR